MRGTEKRADPERAAARTARRPRKAWKRECGGRKEDSGSESGNGRPFPHFTAAPRKYRICRLVSKLFRAQKRGWVRNGGRGRSLNFYSCADETAIFRSIKWALKLSGQFLRHDVLLFSSTAIIVAATPSRRASPLFNALGGPFDGRRTALLHFAGILYKLHPMRVRSCVVARGRIPMCYR